jgi:hypothetical protein
MTSRNAPSRLRNSLVEVNIGLEAGHRSSVLSVAVVCGANNRLVRDVHSSAVDLRRHAHANSRAWRRVCRQPLRASAIDRRRIRSTRLVLIHSDRIACTRECDGFSGFIDCGDSWFRESRRCAGTAPRCGLARLASSRLDTGVDQFTKRLRRRSCFHRRVARPRTF